LFLADDKMVWSLDLNMNVASTRYFLIGEYDAEVAMLQSTEDSVLLITTQYARISAINITADAKVMYMNAVSSRDYTYGSSKSDTIISSLGNQTCAVSLYNVYGGSVYYSYIRAESISLDFSVRNLAIVIIPSSFTAVLLLLTLWKLSRYTDEDELADWGGFLVILSMFCPLVMAAVYPLWLKLQREGYFDGKRGFAALILVGLSTVNVAFYMIALLRNVMPIFQPVPNCNHLHQFCRASLDAYGNHAVNPNYASLDSTKS
jgi:hypothetical protein